MSTLEDARALDRLEKPAEAISAYEKAIEDGSFDKQALLDLALLYFTVADFGYFAAKNLPIELYKRGTQRAHEVLDLLESRFGRDAECSFWRLYIGSIQGCGEFFLDEAMSLVQHGESLVPYMYIFVASEGARGRSEAARLLMQVKGGTTARERYIRSVLEGRLGD